VRRAQPSADIVSPDVGGETVMAVVRHADRLFLVVRPADRGLAGQRLMEFDDVQVVGFDAREARLDTSDDVVAREPRASTRR